MNIAELSASRILGQGEKMSQKWEFVLSVFRLRDIEPQFHSLGWRFDRIAIQGTLGEVTWHVPLRHGSVRPIKSLLRPAVISDRPAMPESGLYEDGAEIGRLLSVLCHPHRAEMIPILREHGVKIAKIRRAPVGQTFYAEAPGLTESSLRRVPGISNTIAAREVDIERYSHLAE